MAFLDNLFQKTYIRDIVNRNKIRNVGEMESLIDILSSAIDENVHFTHFMSKLY